MNCRPLIAVVDDEDSVRRALGRLLRASGYDVRSFASGREFLDTLEFQAPDVLILDLNMPAMNGMDVNSCVARSRPTLPVIVLTSQDGDAIRRGLLDAGVHAFLRKPPRSGELVAAVERALAS